MANIYFRKENRFLETEENMTVYEVAAVAGIYTGGTCGGRGKCRKCNVTIEKDGVSRRCLACSCRAEDEITVITDDISQKTGNEFREIQLPEEFEPDYSKCADKEDYGISIDIGTTTVVCSLWDMKTGEMLQTESVLNPQCVFGADVISRITFIMEDEETNLMKLRKSLVDSINTIISDFEVSRGVNHNDISRFAVVGNTTMSHIFAGISPSKLAFAPFISDYKGGVYFSADEAGLLASEQAVVYIGPNIEGHVGSDITAGILAMDLNGQNGNRLFVDIGTNGEIVLATNGSLLACSTAAGPAFEGNSLSDGMRAQDGAIEHVNISKKNIELSVIGDNAPKGICGSAAVDALAQLLKCGILDSTGRLLKREELQSYDEFSDDILCRIYHGEDFEGFALVNNEVFLTQKDVRQLQMAKGAISAGITALLKEAGLRTADIDEVIIAGAFGSYIRVSSAIEIGLIPDIPEEKVICAGDTAAAGAAMLLMSSKAREKAEELSGVAKHIELATLEGFQEQYFEALSLGRMETEYI